MFINQVYLFNSIEETSGNPLMRSETGLFLVNLRLIKYNSISKSRIQMQDLLRYLNQEFKPTNCLNYLIPIKQMNLFSQIYKSDHHPQARVPINQTHFNNFHEFSEHFISSKTFCTFETALGLALLEAWSRNGFSLIFQLESMFGFTELKLASFSLLNSKIIDFSTPSLRKYLNFIARFNSNKDLQQIANLFGVAINHYKVQGSRLTQQMTLPEDAKQEKIPLIKLLGLEDFMVVLYTKEESRMDGFTDRGEPVRPFEIQENHESFYQIMPEKPVFFHSVIEKIGSILEKINDLNLKRDLIQELSELLQSSRNEPQKDLQVVQDMINSLVKSNIQDFAPVDPNFFNQFHHPENKIRYSTTSISSLRDSSYNSIQKAQNIPSSSSIKGNSINCYEFESFESSKVNNFEEKAYPEQNFQNRHPKNLNKNSSAHMNPTKISTPAENILGQSIPIFFESSTLIKDESNSIISPESGCSGCNKQRYLQEFHSGCNLCTPCLAYSVLERKCINCNSEVLVKESKKFLDSSFNCYSCSDICKEFGVSICGCIICKKCIDKGLKDDHRFHSLVL